MIQALNNQGVDLNIIKAIYDKLIANVILIEEKLKTFSIKLGMRQGYILYILSLSLSLCLFVSLSLSLTHTHTHTQNLNLNT
jgi:hypothetical protein